MKTVAQIAMGVMLGGVGLLMLAVGYVRFIMWCTS